MFESVSLTLYVSILSVRTYCLGSKVLTIFETPLSPYTPLSELLYSNYIKSVPAWFIFVCIWHLSNTLPIKRFQNLLFYTKVGRRVA